MFGAGWPSERPPMAAVAEPGGRPGVPTLHMRGVCLFLEYISSLRRSHGEPLDTTDRGCSRDDDDREPAIRLDLVCEAHHWGHSLETVRRSMGFHHFYRL